MVSQSLRFGLVLLGLVNLTLIAATTSFPPQWFTKIEAIADQVAPGVWPLLERTDPRVEALRAIVSSNLESTVQMLGSCPAEKIPTLQIALIAAGEEALPALPKLIALAQMPETALEICPVLPCLGIDGFKALASGLTNQNEKVRRWSAANLGWPFTVTDVELDQRRRYSEAVRRYETNALEVLPSWLKALEDPSDRVAGAACLGFFAIRPARPAFADRLEKMITTEATSSPRKALLISWLGRCRNDSKTATTTLEAAAQSLDSIVAEAAKTALGNPPTMPFRNP
jgi:hypothetical protein